MGAISRTAMPASLNISLHVHATHAAHVGHAVAAALLLFHQLRNHRVGGEHQAGYGRGVLQRGASHLGRVDHAHLHQVAELPGLRVEAEVTLVLEHLVEHHRRLGTGVVDDDAQRLFERFHHDLDAGLLVVVVTLELAFQRLARAQVGNTAARDDSLFHRRAGRMQRVLDAGLLVLHLDLGRSADLDHRDAAGELRHALLQLLLVVIAGRLLDLHADLLHAGLDLLLVAGAVDDGGVFLAGLDLLRAAEILQRRVLELEAKLLADHRAASENGHVFEHRLAAVAEARRLHGASLQDAADVVHHQRGERLALDFLGDEQQRLAGLGDLLEDRQQLADRRDLLVVEQDVRILEHADLLLGVVDEVRREIAAVELHALDQVELVLERFAVLDGDHAFLADLVHRVGDDLADVEIGVRRDGADLRDLLGGGAGLGDLLQLLDHAEHGLVDAALQVHRVHAGGDELHALAHDRLGQDRRGRSAVTGHVGGLGGDFLHHLRAHVLELVLQLDLLGHRHAVLGDGRRDEGALLDDVAAFRPQRHFHGVGQDVQPMDHLGARAFVETDFFCWHCCFLLYSKLVGGYAPSITPMMSSSRITSSSSPLTLTVCPEYLPNSTLSPGLTSSGISLPESSFLPLPTATLSPWSGFSAAASWIAIARALLRYSSMCFAITRSCNGRIFMRNSPYKNDGLQWLACHKPEFADPERGD